ncbi:MAG: FtsH protease activity modulator HflK [Fusobacteriaceae bacterium]|jgi:membrane protease subunit HflK|nr:FtsH protease activity modulator HflK [Fusobacteriaceae bacterium]
MKRATRPFADIINEIAPKFSKSIFLVIFILIVAILGFDSFYQIEEQEQAVLSTFGVAKPITQPGLHFKIPVIQKIQKVDTTINGFSIGYNEKDNASREEESLMITRDYNFVNVDFYVEYRVSDPVKALYASQKPVLILKNIAQGYIRSVIGSNDIDEVLTTGKNQIQLAIKDAILKKLDEYDLGLQLINITIQDASPPTLEVMEAFKNVETAKQSKETAINNANKYRNAKLPEALAEIDKILQEAETTKAKRVNEANAQVARFNATYEEYLKNPQMTKERMFYETMEEVLPNLKVIIDGTGKTETILPLDSFTKEGE